jgi:hypothetical protein
MWRTKETVRNGILHTIPKHLAAANEAEDVNFPGRYVCIPVGRRDLGLPCERWKEVFQ